MSEPGPMTDPLHEVSPPHVHWTTANIGEALPGVLTPLSWSVWGPTLDRAMSQTYRDMGVLSRKEHEAPSEPLARIFHGRGALQVDILGVVGDRMPGITGPKVIEAAFGEAPDGLVYHPTHARLPAIAWRLPWQFLTMPRRLKGTVGPTRAWWESEVARDRAGGSDLARARASFAEAQRRFLLAVTLQSNTMSGVVQPMYNALDGLTKKAGVGSATALAGGYGGLPEVEIVVDLWRASRGEIDLDAVVALHGFHGPLEGELSGLVWREDRAPLQRMLDEYRRRAEADDPRRREHERAAEREVLERALLAAFPRAQRRPVEGLLALAKRSIPLRGVAKMAFLQAFDVARMSARQIGAHLAAAGEIDDPEDVFFLTADEVRGALPADTGATVAYRRARRDEHTKVTLPVHWQGTPEPRDSGPSDRQVGALTGTGVSPGVVEGLVRVVTDPAFAEVEPDEVLVAPTTDPSWSSIMFISSALVVDIGGALSHAAIVAREMGIPCVVNTITGSRTLRTGDRVRVDGGAGTVDVLARADS